MGQTPADVKRRCGMCGSNDFQVHAVVNGMEVWYWCPKCDRPPPQTRKKRT